MGQTQESKMKDKPTLVKYTREELAHVPDETDWEKVDAMSDEEVYQDALSDKDAQPTDETFWQTAPLPSHFMSIDPDIRVKKKGISNDENANDSVWRKRWGRDH